jgi:glucan phosphorylase
MGRSLTNVVNNLGLEGKYAQALRKMGAEMETVADQERDASLGNGGLGRLAACFLDSIASLDLPGWGYGIRYKYGMFKQVCFPTTVRKHSHRTKHMHIRIALQHARCVFRVDKWPIAIRTRESFHM